MLIFCEVLGNIAVGKLVIKVGLDKFGQYLCVADEASDSTKKTSLQILQRVDKVLSSSFVNKE